MNKGGQSGNAAYYAYGTLGRRIRSVVHGAGGPTCEYYYDGGWRVLAEYRTVGETTVQYDNIYGNYLDEVLLVRDIWGQTDYYYAHDHLYSPVAMLIGSADILERYEYDAYGRRHVFDDAFGAITGSANPIAFTGQRLDVLDGGDLEIMYYKNRYYDTETGRFLSRDPIGYADGMSLYEYVSGNPLIYVDIMGLGLIIPDGIGGVAARMGDLITRSPIDQVCCAGQMYDPKTHCCENAKVAAKVSVYVVNRSGGNRTAWRYGHIDMVLPNMGLIGFFGVPDGDLADSIGMNMIACLNNTTDEWLGGPALRPNYIVGKGPRNVIYPNGDIKSVPGTLSTICELKVCPADAKKMEDEAKKIDADPGTFNLAGRNCSTVATNILNTGGVLSGGISGLDNPQNLLDQLQEKYGSRCFNGYTEWLPGKQVKIIEEGPAPAVPPPGSCDGSSCGS